MSIIFTQEQENIILAYNDVIVECYDNENQSSITHYIVTIDGNDYKVEPNLNNRCYINLSKILTSNLKSLFAYMDRLSQEDEFYEYFPIVKSYINDTLQNTGYSTSFTALVASWQASYGVFNYLDYLPCIGKKSKWLNKTSGGLSVPLDGILTVQYLDSGEAAPEGYSGFSGMDSFYIRTYDNGWKTNGYNEVELYTAREYGVVTIGLSPSILNEWGAEISEDTLFYELVPTGEELETLTITIEQPDNRFPNPTRLAYINSMGATDYFTFKLADTNNLAISKSTYTVDNVETDYSTEVIQTRNLIGNSISEKRMADLQDLWFSPRIRSLTDNYVKVRVTDKGVTVNKRRNNKFFTPTATMKFSNEFRVIQQ